MTQKKPFDWIHSNPVCLRFCNQVNFSWGALELVRLGLVFLLKLHQRTKNLNDLVENGGSSFIVIENKSGKWTDSCSLSLPKHLEPFKSSADPVWTKNDVFLWLFQFTSMTITWGEFTIMGLKFRQTFLHVFLDPTNGFTHIIHFKRRKIKILKDMEQFWSPRYLYKSDVDIIKCINVFFLFPDRSPANSGGQPCKKHELYVSFSDLGWKVGTHSFTLLPVRFY